MDNQNLTEEPRKHLTPKNIINILWLSMLTLGGFVLLVFVISNNFLPDLDLASSITLFASIALTSLFIIFTVGIYTLPNGWFLYYWCNKNNIKERDKISFLICLQFVAIAYSFLAIRFNAPTFIIVISIVVLLIPLMTLIFPIRNFKVKLKFFVSWFKEFYLFISLILISLNFITLSVYLFVLLYQESIHDNAVNYASWVQLGAWLMIHAASASFIASSKTLNKLLQRSLITGFVACTLLLLLANNPAFIVKRTMQLLGLGNLENVTLIVTKNACNTLNAQSNSNLCTLVKGINNEPSYKVEAITIRSRIGKQILIEYISEKNELSTCSKATYTTVLQDTDILSQQQEVFKKS